MIRRGLVAWAILAAVAAEQAAAGEPPSVPAVKGSTPPDLARERTLAAAVSRDRALAAVRALVEAGPRMGGTASGDRAAALVAGWMREAGLAVEIVDDPPKQAHEEKWTVELPPAGLPSAWPWGFSPSLARGAYGLITDDALPEDPPAPGTPSPASGRAVFTSKAPITVMKRAAASGAVAVVTDFGTAPDRFVDAAPIVEVRGGTLLPVFALSYADGQATRTALAANPDVRITLALESSIHEGRPRTVIGSIPGSGKRADEVILVCAHGDSDSGGPGADDNASGEAALLEVARVLSAAATAGSLPADRPAIRFAIWGSELHSSRAYIASRAAELSRHVAIFNYDQAGTGAQRDAIYYEGNDVPWNASLLRTLEAVARDHAGQPGFWTAYTSNPTLGGTDMYMFLPREFQGMGLITERIPVTTVFSSAWDHPTIVKQTEGWQSPGWKDTGPLFVDYSTVYHSSGDLPAKTTEAEPFNIERCARLVLLGILRILEGTAVRS